VIPPPASGGWRPRGAGKALDAFPNRFVRSGIPVCEGDPPIPTHPPSNPSRSTARASSGAEPARGEEVDIERLERSVRELAGRYRAANAERRRLVKQLEDRDRQIATLEEKLREHNQRRRDVTKRLDELIGQIDQIEARFSARAES
jgi:hypothetical protein